MEYNLKQKTLDQLARDSLLARLEQLHDQTQADSDIRDQTQTQREAQREGAGGDQQQNKHKKNQIRAQSLQTPGEDVTADDVLKIEARIAHVEKSLGLMVNIEGDCRYDSLYEGLVDCEHMYRELFKEKPGAGLKNYEAALKKVGERFWFFSYAPPYPIFVVLGYFCFL